MTNYFEVDFKYLVGIVHKRLKANWDYHLAIDGERGVGKSNFADQFIRAVDAEYDINKSMFYTRAQMHAVMQHWRRGCGYVCDEATTCLYRREAMRSDQIDMIKLLEATRKYNLCFAWCLPNFWALDSDIRRDIIHMRIHVIERGHAIVWLKTSGSYCTDPWNLALNQKNFGGGKFRKSPNYAGDLYFPDWQPDRLKVYNEVTQRLLDEADMHAKQLESKKRNRKIISIDVGGS